MPLGTLGYCPSDLLEAEKNIRAYSKAYCDIMTNRERPKGLPPYIQPPKNAVRWQPKGQLGPTFDGLDHLVFSERIPLGYDGLLIQVTNTWAADGFIEGSGTITWRILQDRRYIPYYEAILTTLGTLSVPYDVVGQGIPMLSGQLFQYFVNFSVAAGGVLPPSGQTICALTGYIWPRANYGANYAMAV